MSDFWSDLSSTSMLHVCEQRRLWRDCSPEPSPVAYVIRTIISWAGSNLLSSKKLAAFILSILLIQVAVASYWRKYVNLVLVNCLKSLHRNSVAGLIFKRLDMTIVVDWDVKTHIKQTCRFQIWRNHTPSWKRVQIEIKETDSSIYQSLYSAIWPYEHSRKNFVPFNEPRHEKTCHRGFRPGMTQTGLLSFRD